jgi:hypothetical protein
LGARWRVTAGGRAAGPGWRTGVVTSPRAGPFPGPATSYGAGVGGRARGP